MRNGDNQYITGFDTIDDEVGVAPQDVEAMPVVTKRRQFRGSRNVLQRYLHRRALPRIGELQRFEASCNALTEVARNFGTRDNVASASSPSSLLLRSKAFGTIDWKP